MQYGVYLFGRPDCQTCDDSITQLFEKLKNNGVEILDKKIERSFELKKNYTGFVKFGEKPVSNANLTDDLAIEFLAVNKNRVSLFVALPEDWEQRVDAFIEENTKDVYWTPLIDDYIKESQAEANTANVTAPTTNNNNSKNNRKR